MSSSIIKYSDYPNLTVGCLSKKVYFSVTGAQLTNFFFLPSAIEFTFNEGFIKLTSSNLEVLANFVKKLDSLKFVEKQLSFKKTLRLKGLGLKIFVKMLKRELLLKLGYSHLISLEIPNYITSIKLKKNGILLESFDKIALGDFLKKVYNLRRADAYKGKGFSLHHVKKKLKIIKKK